MGHKELLPEPDLEDRKKAKPAKPATEVVPRENNLFRQQLFFRLSNTFLGPRGPLVLPLVECPSVCKKNLDHNIYRHTCLMNHQKSHPTNPMAQRDPIDAPLTPWDPLGLPLDPLGPCRPTP